MTDLSDLVPALQREIAEPGQFATNFPGVTDGQLVGYLMDAFGQAQLEGYFGTSTLDVTNEAVSPDLSPGAQAFVVMISGERILTNRILNMRQAVRYMAGPVKYETENSASVMVQVLKDLRARRDRITQLATGVGGPGSPVYVLDQHADRIAEEWGYLWNPAYTEVGIYGGGIPGSTGGYI